MRRRLATQAVCLRTASYWWAFAAASSPLICTKHQVLGEGPGIEGSRLLAEVVVVSLGLRQVCGVAEPLDSPAGARAEGRDEEPRALRGDQRRHAVIVR